MPYLFLIVAFGLAQCAAAISGLVEFGLHPILAIVVGGAILAFVSPLLVVPGVYGAVVAWHWHWFWAITLFFPTLVLMFTMTGVFSAWSLWQRIAKRRSSDDSGMMRPGEESARGSNSGPDFPSINPGARDGRTTTQGSSQSTGVAIAALGLVIGGIGVVVFVLHSGAGIQDTRPTKIPTALVASPSSTSITPGPSFDCRAASNPAESAVCQNNSLAALDRQMAGLFASLLLDSGTPDDWQIDQMRWSRRVRDACTTVECLDTAYRSRIESLRIADSSPKTIVSAGQGSDSVAKQDILRWSERVPELAKNSGSQDYFYRLCGMTAEADELRGRVQETSALFYQYGKYVLDVELSGFAQAMDSFAAGEREAQMELAHAYGPPQLACTGDVVRAARARYEVDRNTIAYRPDALAAMGRAVAEAKHPRELTLRPNEQTLQNGGMPRNTVPFLPTSHNDYSPLRPGLQFTPTTVILEPVVNDATPSDPR
jgi:uncharacterized protein